MTRLLAFDTSYLFYRAYFGMPATLKSPQGHPINAVRGVCDTLTRMLKSYSPSLVAGAWDDDWRPAWRVALVPSYKAHRADALGKEIIENDLARQVPWVRSALEAAGVPILGTADHEADDVLASLASRHEGTTLVLTGDKDLFQLISDTTSVIYAGRSLSKPTVFDREKFLAQFGFDAARYPDFAVLRGDPSDGLPGVAGIGEKTARWLVETYSSLKAMLIAAEDSTSTLKPAIRRQLLADPGYLPRARKVVATVASLPVEVPALGKPDEAAITQLTEKFGLGGSLCRLAEAIVAVQEIES